MTRRRLHKRSRRKAKFHKEKDARSKISDSKNVGYKGEDSSHSRSPESVLFESQHADLLCDDKISPEITPKQPRLKSESDPNIDDGIAVRLIQQLSPISHKGRESDLPMCDFKHGTKCINDFSNSENSGERELDATNLIVNDPFDLVESDSFNLSSLSNEPNNNVNQTHDGRSSLKSVDEMACRNISGSATSRSNLESQPFDDGTLANVPGLANSDEKGCLEVKSSQRKDHCILETMDDHYLDKTLSMNDNFVREINSYLDRQSIASTLVRDRASELSHFVILRDERDELGGSKPPDNLDKKKRGPSSGNKRFDITLERIGERLTTNWREFRKIFAHLRRANRRTRDEDAADRSESLLHKYRRFPYVSVSTLSLPTSVLCTPSPKRVDQEVLESRRTKREAETTGISSGSTTPRIGLVKCCRRTTLTFGDEDEGEAARYRQPASRADITDPLPEGKKKDKRRSLPLGPSRFSDETCQEGRIPQLTIDAVSDIELSERDGHGGSPQKIEYYWDGARKPQVPQNIATPRDSRSHRSRRRNISRTIITWLIAICIWLIKKLLHLVNVCYKKLRQKLISSPSSLWTKKFDCLVETMRSESEMLHVMSEKITRLSEDFAQIQTTTEATLNALTTEMNVFREASKKMTEDNMTLLQELKKLRETLDKVQMKSSQPVALPSSHSSSSSQTPPLPSPPLPPPPPPLPSLEFPLSPLPPLPPPPPPPPPPPLSLSFPPKVHISESAPPPPPPLLSSVSLQSPMPIQPTTPNSSRSNKTRTPTRKCSTPLFNRPNITVEDLLKVTLKKAPQSIKENRRNTVPGPKGPIVSLEMLRNVKLKSAKRRSSDQTGRSPRNGRVVKNRAASNINLSPILTGSEGNLERILRRVDRPRRLLSSSSSFRERDFTRETQYQSLETLTCSQSTLG